MATAHVRPTDPDRRQPRSRDLITEKQAGERYGPALNARRLRNLRYQDAGPAYLKVGRAVFYDAAAIDEYLAAAVVVPSAQTA